MYMYIYTYINISIYTKDIDEHFKKTSVLLFHYLMDLSTGINLLLALVILYTHTQAKP